MSPRMVVQKSIETQLDVIAVCDHNASENVPYVLRAALGKDLIVLPGIEVASREEVHTLALFDNLEALQIMQDIVYTALKGLNNQDAFGYQPIVNESDEVEGFNERLLIGATDLTLAEIITAIHKAGGLAIASHIDRESFGVIGQLGFIPEDIHFDALEVSRNLGIKNAGKRFPEYAKLAFIENSDAHFLKDIGSGFTDFIIAEPTVAEFKMAFESNNGRRIQYHSGKDRSI